MDWYGNADSKILFEALPDCECSTCPDLGRMYIWYVEIGKKTQFRLSLFFSFRVLNL